MNIWDIHGNYFINDFHGDENGDEHAYWLLVGITPVIILDKSDKLNHDLTSHLTVMLVDKGNHPTTASIIQLFLIQIYYT